MIEQSIYYTSSCGQSICNLNLILDPIILGRGAGDRGPRPPLPQRRPGGPDQGRAHAHRSLHPPAAQRRAQPGTPVIGTSRNITMPMPGEGSYYLVVKNLLKDTLLNGHFNIQ